jgi:hypothetical protein
MDLSPPTVDPDRLRARLRDPEAPRPPRPTVGRAGRPGPDELALVPPPAYFRALAGVEVPERPDPAEEALFKPALRPTVLATERWYAEARTRPGNTL